MRAGKNDPLLPEVGDHAQIVVLEGIPEVRQFSGQKPQPGAKVSIDVGACLCRPVFRYLRALQAFARGRFSEVDRLLKHRRLPRMESWKMRVSGGFRIIANPETDP